MASVLQRFVVDDLTTTDVATSYTGPVPIQAISTSLEGGELVGYVVAEIDPDPGYEQVYYLLTMGNEMPVVPPEENYLWEQRGRFGEGEDAFLLFVKISW